MLTSIGILAYNEATVIEKTISSLFSQTVFKNHHDDESDAAWEIIIVPNGCTDDTEAIATASLNDHIRTVGRENVTGKVVSIAEGGKSNAWNHFIHDISSPAADFIVMIDADIEFGESETIRNCINALNSDAHAVVSVDQPLKDAVLKTRMTIIERISVAASKPSMVGDPLIAGSFYCSRASSLRQIWMPKGLPVEDGFLRSMIVTNCFREPVDARKIIRVANASHYYETLTDINSIFRHELRMVIGTALNCYLAWDLLHLATDPLGPGAGVTIRNQMSRDPNWYRNLIHNAINNRGFWVLPRGLLLRRFGKKWQTKGPGRHRALLMAFAFFFFDLIVLIAANKRLKRSNAIGYW